ncbi:MarR family transcriptional regulator [Mycolicibacterium aubagnense]|uniref:MarR family winged helix-turn-helix transcriptional regulator n=1 Tax=Mycolicibacterium aubagnense TaxID=319707 RepID=UPI0010FE0CA4|nr:MarR family transcriptional regulator [Mycolicibacterium aubagnense]TLH66375.1 MarR family transcriptional regulator [Mycolicibacterium aubagnense]WGI31363.1 MarR family transcriptional regulator [Mycolicibacterium aubagnense]
MVQDLNADELGAALFSGIALITRRVRHLQAPGELTVPERAALSRLDRGGPASAAELARVEQISPQAMRVTLGDLESRGLVQRQPDPNDGRRVVMSLTASGVELVRHKRDARARLFAKILAEEFTDTELRVLARAAPLIERLGDRI